jgi:class 3 adenylate cyclase
MTDRLNKTSICSIVFLDIIDYSKKPVSDQIDCKDLFNGLINEAIQNVAQNDRIILDTGDGAAITLMGSPEEALFVALTIRDGILAHNKINNQNIRLRIGINLGSVRVVKDINDRPNIIGDGINVAQRIMSFADENQILVSRSYFEVTSRLTHEITDMFTYSGIKQDKHVREHEVYSIKSKVGDVSMPESAFSNPQNEPAEAGMLKDILKPSHLIIALVASVLLILMGWYVLILKPALSESNPMEISIPEPSKQSSSYLPSIDEEANKKVVITSSSDLAPLPSNKASANEQQVVPVKKKVVNSEKRQQKQASSTQAKVANEEAPKKQEGEKSAVEKLKTFFPPAAQPTCTQAQIAMNQCQKN